jgi:pleckstrin homology domain-containing family G member 4
LDNALQLLHGHVKINSVLITLTEASGVMAVGGDKKYNEQLPISHTKLAYASGFEQLLQHITVDNLLSQCNGPLEHDQHEWRDFFKTIEPLQSQCLTAGRRLVAVLNEIRNADLQGPPTRRQLHSQHRALCRALMDAELQHLRRRGPTALAQLQEHMKRIRKRSYRAAGARTKTSGDEHKAAADDSTHSASHNRFSHHSRQSSKSESIASACSEPARQLSTSVESFVEQRLNGLITVFSEIERAAKRLEQLTEQHRERLRELARQRAFEDEINEVRLRGTIKRVNEPVAPFFSRSLRRSILNRFSPSAQVIEWIKSEGENSLKRYGALSLECGDTVRDEEQDFEKFYFISMVS